MQLLHRRNKLLLACFLLFTVHVLLLQAYGFSKCVLIFRETAGANCTGQDILNLTTAVYRLPNITSWLDASFNKIETLEMGAFCHMDRLLELRLANNKIHAIQEGAFQHLEGLHFLDLSSNLILSLDHLDLTELLGLRVLQISNNYITSTEASSLKPLARLQELDLSFNSISKFAVVAQAILGLTELSTLHLQSNQISDLSSGSHLTLLPMLQHLNLAKNNITFLDLSNYMLPNLQSLDLTRNNMSGVNTSSFLNVKSLVKVVFDENPLKISQILDFPLTNLTALHWSSMRPALGQDMYSACQLLRTLPRLTLLDIEHSKIQSRDLHLIGNCSNPTTLDLSTSPLGYLRRNSFASLWSLENIHLSKCKLKQIQPGAFTNLSRLRTLILERNLFEELEELIFKELKNLHYLDLSKNFLTRLNPKTFFGLTKLKKLILWNCKLVTVPRKTFMYVTSLTVLDLCSNSLIMIDDLIFEKLKKLEILLLAGNRISSIKPQGFLGLSCLRYLSLSHNNLYKLDPDRFRFLRALSRLDLSKNQLTWWSKYQKPSPFKELRSLKHLDLSYQDKSRPEGVSIQLFEGLESLEILNLQGNPSIFFQNISLHPLINLTQLDLSDMYPGGIFNFRSDLLQNTRKLRHLKLNSNSLKDLPENAFVSLASLESLSLRDNTLTNISETLVGNLTALTYLDVNMNPLLCACENYWFQNWSTVNPHVQVPLIRSIRCFGRFEGAINFTEQDLSFCNNDIAMVIFLCTFTVTLATMLVTILTVKFRWVLIYSYCMMRAWCETKFRKEARPHHLYDAFVSCCAEDEGWVMENVLFHLEEKGPQKYRLCFKPRDFLPGELYIDSVQNAINNSRKTLCVVSSGYLNSDWCRLEIEMACSRMFYQHEDVLIVVFLEYIPNYRLSTYHRLRKLLRNHSYITWPEDPTQEEPFWMKLQAELNSGENRAHAMQLGITD
ncbi:toll-like receptor 13 [Ambystoma mexicanum]|uniref:toll-like receptor 13 n=1 Tax=Ambystoma mexicanum TaxID=8296 RepID=UPI0037E97555